MSEEETIIVDARGPSFSLPKNACKDGMTIYVPEGWCTNCRRTVGHTHAKVIDGKVYCMKCYPQMVEVYLADQRLKNAQRPA